MMDNSVRDRRIDRETYHAEEAAIDAESRRAKARRALMDPAERRTGDETWLRHSGAKLCPLPEGDPKRPAWIEAYVAKVFRCWVEKDRAAELHAAGEGLPPLRGERYWAERVKARAAECETVGRVDDLRGEVERVCTTHRVLDGYISDVLMALVDAEFRIEASNL